MAERVAIFEFDPAFRELGLELSPYKMAVGSGLLTAQAHRFDGGSFVLSALSSLSANWRKLSAI